MNVLIVEDSQRLSDLISEALAERGDIPRQAFSLRMAENVLKDFLPDAVILDAMFPTDIGGGADFNAPNVLNCLEGASPEARPFAILMSGDDRAAAHFDTIRDWWHTGRIVDMISKNQEGGWNFFKEILLHHLHLHRPEDADAGEFVSADAQKWLKTNEIVSCDPAMYKLAREIRQIVAATDNLHSILIVGANGTGKSLIARAIHREMELKEKGKLLPFFHLHCAEIVASSFQSKFFGHVKGAFTDARETVRGALEASGEGVLFLDDIQLLYGEARGALLKPFEERVFHQVGSTAQKEFQARIVSSTNIDLERLRGQGMLPEDFYERVAWSTVFVPTLSQRPDDVEVIATELGHRGPKPKTLRADAMRALRSYPWPGNVRQLRNVIQRIQINHEGSTVTLPSLRSLGIDYLGKPIEWLPPRGAAVSDAPLRDFGWQGGWAELGPDHEETVLAWLRVVIPESNRVDALAGCLRGRSAPRPIHYYKALLFAHVQKGQASHQALQDVLQLGWDWTNKVLCYLAGGPNGVMPGFNPEFLTRSKNVRGKYVYAIANKPSRASEAGERQRVGGG